jgi:hypothetical protein
MGRKVQCAVVFPGVQVADTDGSCCVPIGIPDPLGGVGVLWRLTGLFASSRTAGSDFTTIRVGNAWSGSTPANYFEVGVDDVAKLGRSDAAAAGSLTISPTGSLQAWIFAAGGHSDITLNAFFELYEPAP